MKSRLTLGVLLALLVSMFTVQPAHAAVGLRIASGRIVEANGTPFVMRGTSHPHVWFPTQTSAFANIKATGANTVRVVLGSGQRWGPNTPADVANVITLCKNARLICVLEVHDTTGFGEEGAAGSLDQATTYWLSLASVLRGQENYVIINIGNEPYGNNEAANANWASATSNAIGRLRAGGLEHLIMVDAPNWGQDWRFIMRDGAQAVFNSDPQRNIVFSVHMYGVFDTAAEVTDYMARFQAAGLPLVVGEFGFNHSDGNPDEDTIMAQAQQRNIGYIGWSWSGNGGGVEYLDMVINFNPAQLSPWGERIINGANGIRATSRQATIYGGGVVDTSPPTTPGTPTASGLTSSSVALSWAASTDNIGVTGYDVVRVQGTTETAMGASGTNSTTVTGLTPQTAYSFAIYARDAAGNRSNRSGTVSVTTPAGPVGTCTVTYRVTNSWPSGFQADVAIRNNATTAVNGWTLRWSFANGQTISNMWGGNPSRNGAEVIVANAPYTANIPAGGGSVSVGFVGGSSGTNTNPAAFTLNNATCITG